MQGFKIAILAECKNCQNGTFEPVHEIQKKNWPKDFFWAIMKVPYTKICNNFFHGRPNPGKYKLRLFKKGLTWFQKFFLFRVPIKEGTFYP